MKSTLQCVALTPVALLLTIVLAAEAFSADYYVRMSGSDSATGRTPSTAFRTINQAFDVLGPNDRVFIGAGRYPTQAAARGAGIHPGTSTSIIGDVRGIHTGDPGEVVITTTHNEWSIRLERFGAINLSGLTFEGPESTSDRHYGLRIDFVAGPINISNVSMKKLHLGIQVANVQELTLYDIELTDIHTPCRIDNATQTIFKSILLDSCIQPTYILNNGPTEFHGLDVRDSRGGVYAIKTEKLLCTESRFRAEPNQPGGFVGLRSDRCSIEVQDCRFDHVTTAILQRSSEAATIENVEITNSTYAGIDLQANELRIRDVAITGALRSNGGRQGSGLALNYPEETTPLLHNIEIKEVAAGMSLYSDCEFQQVHVSKCHIGLALRGSRNPFTLGAKSDLVLTDNETAIYSNPNRDIGSELRLIEYNISNNRAPIRAVNISLVMRDCKIEGNQTGITIYRGIEIDIRRCSFDGNDTNPKIYPRGADLEAEVFQIEDSSFTDNSYGLMLECKLTERISLRNLKFANSTRSGLVINDGEYKILGSHNLSFADCGNAIELNRTNLAIQNQVFDAPNTAAIRANFGSIDVVSCRSSGGSHGVHANRCTSVTIRDSEFTDTVRDCIDVNACDEALVRSTLCSGSERGNGVSIVANEGQKAHISDSKFTNNKESGIFIVGIDVNKENISNNISTDNGYGIRVERGDLVIHDDIQVKADSNRYGVFVTGGNLVARGLDLKNNEIGITCREGDLSVTDCRLDVEHMGIIHSSASGAKSMIADCELKGGRSYGISLVYTREQGESQILRTNLSSFGHAGIRLTSDSVSQSRIHVAECHMTEVRYGIIADAAEISIQDCSAAVRSYGVLTSTGVSRIDRVSVRGGSVGLYLRGASGIVNDCKIEKSYRGAYFLTDYGTVTNSLISGSYLGVSANRNGTCHVNNCTLAGTTGYGVYTRGCRMSVANTIIESRYYWAYNSDQNTPITMDHVLLNPGTRGVVGEVELSNEIVKAPVFADSSAGDFRLAAGSPAINAGRDLSSWTRLDILGNARPSFGKYEIGAYEFLEESGSLRILDWDETAR